MVHVVPADMKISKLSMCVNRREEYDLLRCDEDGWPPLLLCEQILSPKTVEYISMYRINVDLLIKP